MTFLSLTIFEGRGSWHMKTCCRRLLLPERSSAAQRCACFLLNTLTQCMTIIDTHWVPFKFVLYKFNIHRSPHIFKIHFVPKCDIIICIYLQQSHTRIWRDKLLLCTSFQILKWSQLVWASLGWVSSRWSPQTMTMSLQQTTSTTYCLFWTLLPAKLVMLEVSRVYLTNSLMWWLDVLASVLCIMDLFATNWMSILPYILMYNMVRCITRG